MSSQEKPFFVTKENYDTAKKMSMSQDLYVWDDKSYGFLYIQPPQKPPFVVGSAPDNRLNFLWQQKPDYCHLTLELTDVAGGKSLRNMHLTIGPGQPLAIRPTHLQVQRTQGEIVTPTTVTDLVDDTVDDEKLKVAFASILTAANLRDEWKKPIRDNVLYRDGNTPVWVGDAGPVVLQQCRQILTQLQSILVNFGMKADQKVPNTRS